MIEGPDELERLGNSSNSSNSPQLSGDVDVDTPMPPKRACDACITRKVKCSGSWPCDACRDAVKRVLCTYLRPARKRGPKVRPRQQERRLESVEQNSHRNESQKADEVPPPSEDGASFRISRAVLAPILLLYQQYSYSVWPVVNADEVLERLDDIEPGNTGHGEENFACLVTALCAATMAQLHLAPVTDDLRTVDSVSMAQACLRIRGLCQSHREHLDMSSVLVSFFLHVYHAKLNQCTLAMMYIQEAISGAQILRLDHLTSTDVSGLARNEDLIANPQLVFPLLWVSERGYALHLGLPPSYIDPPSFAALEGEPATDTHVQGLLDLVRLFIAFDQISMHRRSPGIHIAADLADTETRLSFSYLRIADCNSTRTADCHITRQWMRTILWQEALSFGLLSSSSNAAVMRFSFPAQVGHDLLESLRYFSETDLLPLGRDQVSFCSDGFQAMVDTVAKLLKSFEIANSLADICLLASSQYRPRFEFGPLDFLHALYQKLLPFFEQDVVLNSILRTKTAEVLVKAPARLLTVVLGDTGTDCPLVQGINEEYQET